MGVAAVRRWRLPAPQPQWLRQLLQWQSIESGVSQAAHKAGKVSMRYLCVCGHACTGRGLQPSVGEFQRGAFAQGLRECPLQVVLEPSHLAADKQSMNLQPSRRRQLQRAASTSVN